MLPQIKSPTNAMSGDSKRSQNIASRLITEDHLRLILGKAQNKHYRAWDNKFTPKNSHSAFGDFPKSHLLSKTLSPKQAPVHEISHAQTFVSKTFPC